MEHRCLLKRPNQSIIRLFWWAKSTETEGVGTQLPIIDFGSSRNSPLIYLFFARKGTKRNDCASKRAAQWLIYDNRRGKVFDWFRWHLLGHAIYEAALRWHFSTMFLRAWLSTYLVLVWVACWVWALLVCDCDYCAQSGTFLHDSNFFFTIWPQICQQTRFLEQKLPVVI